MNPSRTLKSAKVRRESAKVRRKSAGKNPAENPWLAAVVKAKEFTTEDLNVPCVEVVTEATGKVFAGPYYLDQLELLRDTLRGMPKRERYVVFVGSLGYWIYRKEATR